MIVINENFVFRKIYNVSLLVPIKRNPISNEAIYLNETAALIFQYCNDSNDIEELVNRVFANFVDADQDEVMPELEEYIMNLISEGFLLER